MFKTKWPRLGVIVSDEGFEVSFSHKSVYYCDARGKFEFGYEAGMLSGMPFQVAGDAITLSQLERAAMVDLVAAAIRWSGSDVEVFYV